MKGNIDYKSGGFVCLIGSFVDVFFVWKDFVWLCKYWSGFIVFKGVMMVMDVKFVVEYKLDGIVFSNYGGRNLDISLVLILVLLEL